MDDAVKVELSEPVQFGSVTITELVIKKPKARHFRRMPAVGGTMGDILDMLGALSGQPKAVIDELSVPDMLAAQAVVEGFIEAGRGTGSEASR